MGADHDKLRVAMKRIVSVICLSAAMSAGCGDSTAEPEPEVEPEFTYYEDVKPVIDAHCTSCHSEGNIAPFSLDNYTDVSARASLVQRETMARRMPPWGAAPGVREYFSDISLSDDQIAMIDQWVQDGSPQGDPANEGAPIELNIATLERVDVSIQMPEPYEPDRSIVDDYRCFVLPWTETETKFITGFRGVPGNTNSVHHLVAFIIQPEQAALYDTFDDIDPGAGYECYGTTAPSSERANGVGANQPITFGGQWAPGMGSTLLPEGTGQPVRPGSRIALQVHYSTVVQGDLTDQSRNRNAVGVRMWLSADSTLPG